MYEEDRIRALEMYEEIFEEVNNENAVLQLLVSPTRQAVNLARAYDARQRKFQDDDGQEPAYQLVIEDIRRQADVLTPAAPKNEADQLSLFPDAEVGENVFDSLGFGDFSEVTETGTEAAHDASQEFTLFPDEDREDEPAPLSPPPAVPIEQSAEEAPSQAVNEFSDTVDAFLAEFTIHDELGEEKEAVREQQPISQIQDEDADMEAVPQYIPEPQKNIRAGAAVHVSIPVQAPHPEKAMKTQTVQESYPVYPQRQEQHSPGVTLTDLPDMTGTAERKANVPLLILFILLAVPVGLLCLAVILPAAGLSLGLAVLSVCVGFSGLIAAFSFSVFADILLVFGLSLSLSALGLLLSWLFLWLLIGAIPGIVRAMAALARKLCYKEVSA